MMIGRKWIGGVLGAILVALFLAGPLSVTKAGWGWCIIDPVLEIEGHTVNVEIAVPQGNLDDIAGNIPVLVAVPRGVEAEVLEEATLPNGHTTRTVIIERGRAFGPAVPVMVCVYVPTDGEKFPVELLILVDGELVRVKEGRAGVPIIAFFALPGEGENLCPRLPKIGAKALR